MVEVLIFITMIMIVSSVTIVPIVIDYIHDKKD